jgi:UDP-galactopyranose mutase
LDCLIVGCGLTGSVIAHELAKNGLRVTIWERRNHIGGNMFDYLDEHGILVHKYGPHTFHTFDKRLYDYICRFGDWKSYKLRCGAVIDGQETPTPFNYRTIDQFFSSKKATELKTRLVATYGQRTSITVLEALNNEDGCIREYAQWLFNKDYSPYTAKQWGVDPHEIDPSVLNRVPLRLSYDEGYFDDRYQVMPKKSYRDFFEALLDHPLINIVLRIEALEHLRIGTKNTLLLDNKITPIPIVYTGALDELFACREGRLPYRSLKFEWRFEKTESYQEHPVVAYPAADLYTRITEYRKLPKQKTSGTTLAVEYPCAYRKNTDTEPYYPVLTQESQRQAQSYRTLAAEIDKLYPCGRLADFKYYNMDQALARALDVSRVLMKAYRLENDEYE